MADLHSGATGSGLPNVLQSVVSHSELKALLTAPKDVQQAELERINRFLAGLTAQERVL